MERKMVGEKGQHKSWIQNKKGAEEEQWTTHSI